MGELLFPAPSLAVLLCLAGALLTHAPVSDRARWRACTFGSLLITLVSAVPVLELGFGGHADLADPWLAFCRVDELSALLLPFVGVLFTVAFTVRPRREATPSALRRSFFAEAAMLALMLARTPLVIAAGWLLLIVLYLSDLRDGSPRAFLLASRYLGISAVFMGLGVLAMSVGDPRNSVTGSIGVSLVLMAAMVRKAIVPFHGWMPELFEHGKLGPTILFSVPQVAAYVVARLVVPYASEAHLAFIGGISLLTAVYGAAAFVVQKDGRRAFGYFFMSQSALVMAGLDCTSVDGVVGGLSLWLSSGIALAGMAAALWMLESRRGPLRIDRLSGGYENKPLLATSFLLLGLASVGFPGTLGFVAEELLINGAVTQFPHVGFAVVIASSLSAIGVLRMFFALFGGTGEARVRTNLRRRELFAMTSLVVFLLVGGLAPEPITALETRVARRLLDTRPPADPSAQAPH